MTVAFVWTLTKIIIIVVHKKCPENHEDQFIIISSSYLPVIWCLDFYKWIQDNWEFIVCYTILWLWVTEMKLLTLVNDRTKMKNLQRRTTMAWKCQRKRKESCIGNWDYVWKLQKLWRFNMTYKFKIPYYYLKTLC